MDPKLLLEDALYGFALSSVPMATAYITGGNWGAACALFTMAFFIGSTLTRLRG